MVKILKVKNSNKYDVIVIGGGPAGMFSAGRAGERGLKVLLLEKNESVGKKLLLTGGGRCNLTNAEFDVHAFLAKLGDSGNFLFSIFAQHGVKDTMDFFNSRGLLLKTEAGKRVFPGSDSAPAVQNTLFEYMKMNGVEIMTNANVLGFIKKGKKIESVSVLVNGKKQKIFADNFILACGGTSHPETGSTGDGYAWLREIGHKVILPSASLVPIAIKDDWVKKLQGMTLPEVKISVFKNDPNLSAFKQASPKAGARASKKVLTKKGRILFTHFGISGPTVINMSGEVGKLLKNGTVGISLDILPKLDYGMLNSALLQLFDSNKNKIFKNCISALVPKSLVPAICELSKINGETFIHEITREERIVLIHVLKDMRMTVEKLLGPDKSIVAGGGVDLAEVNFKTMSSLLCPNLFFAGDILNIERSSGGFSLQICWTTGYVAGNSVNRK